MRYGNKGQQWGGYVGLMIAVVLREVIPMCFEFTWGNGEVWRAYAVIRSLLCCYAISMHMFGAMNEYWLNVVTLRL